MSEPAHAPLPPSSADRWVNCGRSPSLEAAFPDLNGSDESEEGTAAHWLLAEALHGRAHPAGTIAENGIPVTDEMVRHIGPLVGSIKDVVATVKGSELQVERRVFAKSVHRDNWGTCDAFIIDVPNKVVYVWDFKYGFGFVDHVGNWQLIDYAQGVIDSHALIPGDYRIEMTIYQPRCYQADAAMRKWVISGQEHAALVDKLRMAAKLVSPNSAATTGPHCKHCRGIPACEANRRMVGYICDQSLKTGSDLPAPSTLGSEYALLLESQARLKARIVGLEAAISANPAGTGWVVEQKDGREKWASPVAEVFALGDMMGVDLRKPPEAITPVQAREKGLDAEVSKAYSVKTKGEPKLVRATASAAALAFSK